MNEKIHAFRIKYKNNPGWYWLIATVFLFPILPEYISPFILFAAFIVFKRQWTREGRKAKVGTLGKLELCFMSLALLSALWSDSKLDTLGAAGLWWGMFLIQVMIYNLVNTRKKIDNVLKTITLSATANGIIGAIQICTYLLYDLGYISKKFVFITPFYKNLDYAVYSWLPFRINTKTFDDRASGFYSNPNLLCTSMLVAYPISIYLFLNAKNKKQKFFYFMANLIISAGISSTLTRAGCVIALLGWVFMFVILAKRHAKELLTIFLPTVGIIVPSILTRYGFIFTSNSIVSDAPPVDTDNIVSNYIANYTNTENFITAQRSTNAHLEIWQSVWDYITNHIHVFIGGLGFGCESTGAFLLENYNLNKPHAHNFIFEIWAELGIIGLVLLFAIICCTFGKLMEINANNGKKFDLVFCVFTSLMLLLLFGLSDYIFNSPKQIILFMIVIGLTQAISQCYDKTLIKSTDDLMKATSKTFKEIVKLKK
ncbi:MAG: O-antigen ligase family protein [Eubacterium sp.]|nr:O-antigen ligase family protein [Eubacterium sp.]